MSCWRPSEKAYSCEKWKSNENKRLNTSGSVTTWPPSCRAASPWSTPTPRTSPSLTKETGWNEGGEGEEKAAAEDKRVQVTIPPPTPNLAIKEEKRRYRPLFPLSGFFISSYLCLVVVCVQWRVSTSPSSVFLVFQEKFFSFAFILFCTTTQPCFCWISCDEIPPCLLLLYMKITFSKSHLFLLLVCTLMFKKKREHTRKKKRKNEGMLHLSLVLQHSFATLWLNTASSECCFILSSFIYLLLLKHFNRPVSFQN